MRTGVWTARLGRDLTEEEEEAMRALLPPERRERLDRTADPSRRREALCAWTLLRKALWEELGWEDLPEVALTGQGKPWFPDHPRVWFSLSHTDGAAAAALSASPVGVDIERIRPVKASVMRRVGDVEDEEEFFRRWVEMEALGKRSGRGVAAMLEEGPGLWGGDCYRPLDTFPGYAAGIAVSPGEAFPEAIRYTL